MDGLHPQYLRSTPGIPAKLSKSSSASQIRQKRYDFELTGRAIVPPMPVVENRVKWFQVLVWQSHSLIEIQAVYSRMTQMSIKYRAPVAIQ